MQLNIALATVTTPSLTSWHIDAFGISLSLAPKTVCAYRHKVSKFALWAGNQGIDNPSDVTSKDVRMRLSEMLDGSARSTVAVSLAAMKRYSSWAVAAGFATTDVCRSLKIRNPYHGLPSMLDRAALERLLDPGDISVDGPTRLRDDAIIELIYGSGLRASEVCGLRVGDLDVKRKQIAVMRSGGSGKDRVWIPLTESASAALARHLAASLSLKAPGDIALFLNMRGEPLTPRSIHYLIRGRSEGRATPASLRATCAIHLIEGGCNLRAVQEVMGIREMATVERYVRASSGRLKAALGEFHPRG